MYGNDPNLPDLSYITDWYVARAAAYADREYGVGLACLGLDEDMIADILEEERIDWIPGRGEAVLLPYDIVDAQAERYGLQGRADLAY